MSISTNSGVLFVDVLITKAPLFGVYIKALIFNTEPQYVNIRAIWSSSVKIITSILFCMFAAVNMLLHKLYSTN